MKIDKLRGKIDVIDESMVQLLSERFNLSMQIGRNKQKAGLDVFNLEREKAVMQNVTAISERLKVNPDFIEDVFSTVMLWCRKEQEQMVAFQGERGAYSELAAFSFFGKNIRTLACREFEDVFDAVQNGLVSHGIVPVENSTQGDISKVMDLLLERSVSVAGEARLRVSHCLISDPSAELESIRQVYSHPQALAQCEGFLRKIGVKQVATYDTAGSLKLIKGRAKEGLAAIASRQAARLWSMKVLKEGIEDNPNNFTRFLIISKKPCTNAGNKVSIIFSVRHEPGTLLAALRPLAESRLNLTKISSRPTKAKPWEYNFFVDFEGDLQDENVKQALREMEKATTFMKVLGCYKRQGESNAI